MTAHTARCKNISIHDGAKSCKRNPAKRCAHKVPGNAAGITNKSAKYPCRKGEGKIGLRTKRFKT